jgi:hypothetical protein
MLEIKLKYYNSVLCIGFNNPRESVYDFNEKVWLPAKEHLGRLVYGNKRIPYKKIKNGIDTYNFLVQNYCPF